MIGTTGMQKDLVTQICEQKADFAIGLKDANTRSP